MIEYSAGIDIEGLNQQIISDELVQEANARERKTVPTGEYVIKAENIEVKKDDRDPEKFKRSIPGRLLVRIQAGVYASTDRTTRLAGVFFDLSPETHRFTTKDGKSRLDTPSQLWGQAAKAFGGTTTQDILNALESYPLLAYIRESFRLPTGDYVNARSPEDRIAFFEKGAMAYNDVSNVKAVK